MRAGHRNNKHRIRRLEFSESPTPRLLAPFSRKRRGPRNTVTDHVYMKMPPQNPWRASYR